MKRYGDLATAWFQCIDVSKDGQVQEWLGENAILGSACKDQLMVHCVFVCLRLYFLCLKSVYLHVLHDANKQVCMDGFVCLSVRLFVCLFVCIITVPMYLPTHGNVLGTFVLCKSCVSHAHTYTMHVNLVFM